MSRSKQLFEQAQSVIPGGVNSPVRAFNGVGGGPLFIEKAQDAYIYEIKRIFVMTCGMHNEMI